MANTKRIEAHKEKYTGRDLLTYEEVMDYLGVKRSTLYSYASDLNIETKKFKKDKRRYFMIADVKILDRSLHEPGFFEAELKRREEQSRS